MDKKEILKFYVEIIKSILEIYRLNQNKNTQKITKRILNWIIREYKGKIKLYASSAAIEWAKSQGINDSLSNYNWKDQVKKKEKGGLGDKKRENLHLEHIIPIFQIIKNLFETKTSNDIQNILNEISVAWIKRDQQQKLDKGHKKVRGENLKKCLECCKEYCGELTEIGEYKVPLDYDNESEKNDIL